MTTIAQLSPKTITKNPVTRIDGHRRKRAHGHTGTADNVAAVVSPPGKSFPAKVGFLTEILKDAKVPKLGQYYPRDTAWLRWLLREYRVPQGVFAPLVGLSEKRLSLALNDKVVLRPEAWDRIRAVTGLIARYPRDRSMWSYEKEGDQRTKTDTTLYPALKPDAHLSIVFTVKNEQGFLGTLLAFCGHGKVDCWDRKYRFTSRCPERGFTIQASPKFKGMRYGRLEVFFPKDFVTGFRFEDHVANLLRKLVLPYADPNAIFVTRTDLAFDYPVPLEAFHFITKYAREAEVYYRSGKLTGIRIGSRKSPVMIRVYDKRRELWEAHGIKPTSDEPCTRYEVQVRPQRLKINKLHRLKNPLMGQPFFSIKDVCLEPPYDHFVDRARNEGLGVVAMTLPTTMRGELRRRLEAADSVGAWRCPPLVFTSRWRKVAKRFLRAIGIKPAKALKRRAESPPPLQCSRACA